MRIRKHEANQLIWSAVNIPSNPRPAATVVVVRDGAAGFEVFMVRRHEGTAFMGGAHVFPGGRVDAADAAADETWCDGIASGRFEMKTTRGVTVDVKFSATLTDPDASAAPK